MQSGVRDEESEKSKGGTEVGGAFDIIVPIYSKVGRMHKAHLKSNEEGYERRLGRTL